ncbi:hypothetical protein [Mesorhizobium sp. L-2-11]|uniref:hypothetical protein n=1 Tax=Mesorhizobium sp. L-2-11 TaxID=2744521 RepID=UPI0019254E43|nr:hypothetical protein [Mesorhizobium sp. L-2-11]
MLAQQVPEQVLAPEQALVLQAPGPVQALQGPGPGQASVQRALAPGPAWLQPAVHQALAPHRLFQKYNKRQWPG